MGKDLPPVKGQHSMLGGRTILLGLRFGFRLRAGEDGATIDCRSWIAELIETLTPTAEQNGLIAQLRPLQSILTGGNQAMRWIRAAESGREISDLLHQSGLEMVTQELQPTSPSGKFFYGKVVPLSSPQI